MVIGRKKHECVAAPAPPRLMGSRLVPTPRCFHRAASSSPWLAVDPVLRADCMAFCRNVRLAIVAVFAVFGLCRMANAAEHNPSTPQTCTSNLLMQNGCFELA